MQWSEFRDRTGLTIAEMAQVFKVSERTVSNWIAGDSPGRKHHQLRRDDWEAGRLVLAWSPKPALLPLAEVPDDATKVYMRRQAVDTFERMFAFVRGLDADEQKVLRRVLHAVGEKNSPANLTGASAHEYMPAMEVAIDSSRHLTAPLSNPRRVNMVIDADLIEFVDEYARKLSRETGGTVTRSEVFRGLVRSLRTSVK